MLIVSLILVVLIISFGGVLLFGAPYLPTLKNQVDVALDLIDLKPGDTLIELGSGDGRVLKAAAKRGIVSIGYELNPVLYMISLVYCFPERRLISIHFQSFWRAPLDQADGIYVFLLDRFMNRLNKKIAQEIKKQTRVVSFAFAFPGRNCTKHIKGLNLYEFIPPR